MERNSGGLSLCILPSSVGKEEFIRVMQGENRTGISLKAALFEFLVWSLRNHLARRIGVAIFFVTFIIHKIFISQRRGVNWRVNSEF